MHETQVVERISHMALIADHEAAEVTEPGEEALNLPAAPIPTERTPILRLGAHTSPAVWRDHLDTQCGQSRVKPVRVIGPIPDQSSREVVDKAGVAGRRDEGNLVRRSRCGTDGERKTKTVCHCQEFRPFAPLGLSHTFAPFLATTKVPSMKHSDRSIPPRAFRSVASASRTRSKAPSRTQRWKRRWQVW